MMIKGQSLYLRPVRHGDVSHIHEANQNEEIMVMTGTRESMSLWEITNQYKRYRKDPTRYDFAVCLVENDELIGDVTLLNVDRESKKATLHIVIHQRHQRCKGYGTEATLLAQEFVFKELVLNRLELKVLSHNISGIKLCEKTGFKTEGVLRQSLYFNHQYSDDLILAMIRKDYNDSRPADWQPSFAVANR